MNKLIIKTIFISIAVSVSVTSFSQKHVRSGLEKPAVKKHEEIICHTAYCFVYSENHEQAKWIAYVLTKEMTLGKEQRKDRFAPDPKVKTHTANNEDYKSSGYDRGHLAPAADMSFCPIALDESFYYSNISPQDPSFNRGMWKKLENEVRMYAQSLNRIYVVTGPVLSNKKLTNKIGPNNVSVPEHYYKAILYVSDSINAAIGFLMPNKKIEGKSIYSYSLSIDDLETQTGIDFFQKLPHFIEKKLEKKTDTIFWKTIVQFNN